MLKINIHIILFLIIIPWYGKAQVNVYLPDIKVNTGNADIYFPVVIDDITGKNISSYQFEIHYNKNLIYLLNAKASGTISSNCFFNANADTANGVLIVACASIDNLSGSGTLISILVKFRKEGISILTFRNNQNEEKFLFNSGDPAANTSDGSVTIGNPAKSINLIYPDGGNVFTSGSTDSVEWSSMNVTGIKIELSTDNGIAWTGIVDNYNAGNNNFKFIVPNTPSSQAKVRISDQSNSSLFDESQANFVIENLVGVDNVFHVVPAGYELFQNFPNPFNPVTNIYYSVPVESFVSIKVYDLPGNEIYTLINEVKQAGKYSVEVYGNKLASGTYIYKMTAGNYKETKKMIVLK